MNQKLDKTSENKPKRDEKGRLLPGYTANPEGRPKRSWSIKDKIWQRFEDNPEELEAFIKELLKRYKGLVWTMLEGKPPQDLTLGQNPELPFIIKIEKKENEGKNSPNVSNTI